MTIEWAIYLCIGLIAGGWYIAKCSERDTTQMDHVETAIGATVLLVGWPVALGVIAWRSWE